MSAGRPIAEQSLPELLDTWRQWNLTDSCQAAARREADGRPDQAPAQPSWPDGAPRVDPLDALAANHRLARLLTGWQWLAIFAARTAGASWEQIGDALDTSGEQALAGYLAKVENAERHTPDFFTAAHSAGYRAVLDDPAPSAGPGPAAPDGRCQR